MVEEVQASSELSKIAPLNGDFRRNYGILLGDQSDDYRQQARHFSSDGWLLHCAAALARLAGTSTNYRTRQAHLGAEAGSGKKQTGDGLFSIAAG